MARNWKVIEHSTASRWAVKYASINPHGDIVLSRVTVEAMGSPKKVVLLYDTESETIGLRPAGTEDEDLAFPLRKHGPHGGYLLRGFKLMKDHNIKLTQTMKFPDLTTELGVLMLDLKTTEPVKKA